MEVRTWEIRKRTELSGWEARDWGDRGLWVIPKSGLGERGLSCRRKWIWREVGKKRALKNTIPLVELGWEVCESKFKEYLILPWPKRWSHFEGLNCISPFFTLLFLYFHSPSSGYMPTQSSNPKFIILSSEDSSGPHHPNTSASPQPGEELFTPHFNHQGTLHTLLSALYHSTCAYYNYLLTCLSLYKTPYFISLKNIHNM